ncbi:hypothetical protein [Streptosporangium sp. NPDC000396]|uniref:hypothetical protein n=1 Tax=Streptosporangium sp. NPDC000396 TaxID=3366185 RepID=UPI0036BB25EF
MPRIKKTAMAIAVTLTACTATLGAFAAPALADPGGASGPGVRAAAVVNPATTVPVATVQWASAPWDSSIFVRPDNAASCGDSRDVFVGTGIAAGARDIGFHVIVP